MEQTEKNQDQEFLCLDESGVEAVRQQMPATGGLHRGGIGRHGIEGDDRIVQRMDGEHGHDDEP